MYPVWSEHYDFDEIEEIVSWGIDRDWLLKELQSKHSGNEHCLYPLLQTNPFPPRMRIFIKARFKTTGGQDLEGYVMDEDAFVIHIFYSDGEYGFSRHPLLENLNKEQEERLKEKIGEFIFPLTYETDFLAQDGKRICGEFVYAKSA